MREEEIVADYAIGGATAVLFYAEPTRTYDVDVFALLPTVDQSELVSLTPVYRWAELQGFTVDAEHVLVHDVPVQILPAYNALVIDAIHTARAHDYQGVPGRVVDPEHLIALSLQAGGPRRRSTPGSCSRRGSLTARTFAPFWMRTASTWRFLMTPDAIAEGVALLFARQREWHRQQARQPLQEKVRILPSCSARSFRFSFVSARAVHGSGRGTSRPDASLREAVTVPGLKRPNTNVADCPIRRGSITRLTGCDH